MVCMVVYLSLLFATLSACNRGSDSPSVRFVDATEEVGIQFSHTSGARGDYFLFETMGSGAAFLDYDRDGWLDIYAHTAPHEWKNTEFEIYGKQVYSKQNRLFLRRHL